MKKPVPTLSLEMVKDHNACISGQDKVARVFGVKEFPITDAAAKKYGAKFSRNFIGWAAYKFLYNNGWGRPDGINGYFVDPGYKRAFGEDKETKQSRIALARRFARFYRQQQQEV